jgi:hypothetical protein
MNVEIRTETPMFLFWEYLFQKFGILSLTHRANDLPYPHAHSLLLQALWFQTYLLGTWEGGGGLDRGLHSN